MAQYLIYFIVIILANTLGAISGMGGGVIIKPVFDTLAFHSLVEIAFYSTVAVFTMSIASTYRQLKNGIQINWPRAGSISLGSIIGGVLGSKLFAFLLTFFKGPDQVQLIQIILTIISLGLVLWYTLKSDKTINLTNLFAYFAVGLFLGGFSTLLGIGGGPINVSLLVFCFGLGMKEATVYSIITIFFSQLARLVEIGLTSGFVTYDLSFLWVIIPAALLGGYLGGILSGKVAEAKVTQIFILVVILVMAINFYNGIQLFA